MNGRPTFSKSLHRMNRAQSRAGRGIRSLKVGSWRFEENEDGDLVIINMVTEEVTILLRANRD